MMNDLLTLDPFLRFFTAPSVLPHALLVLPLKRLYYPLMTEVVMDDLHFRSRMIYIDILQKINRSWRS